MSATQASRPLLIGVTGNIGSGKSSFCAFLESLGFKVYYADKIAREVLNEPEILAKLKHRWGDEIVGPDGKANNAKIASRVFGHVDELAFLNSQVHPGTLKRMQDIVNSSDRPVLVFEVPLLFEAGLEGCFDHLVLVSAARDHIFERLGIREGLSPEALVKRLNAQMPDSEKASRCDTLIVNNSGLEELRERASRFAESIGHIVKRCVKPFYAG